MSETVLVTGGAGYIGALLCDELLESGAACACSTCCCTARTTSRRTSRPRASRSCAATSATSDARRRALAGRRRGRAPRRDRRRSRLRARPRGVPGGQRRGQPRRSCATRSAAGVGRLVFASTCSNYGRMADPTVPITEEGELAPVSLYAEQKVGIERALLDGDFGDLRPDLPALRHGLRRRAAHALRPHRQRVHARPVGRPRARGVRRAVLAAVHPRRATPAAPCATVLDADPTEVAGEVFNAGRSGRELPQARPRRGDRAPDAARPGLVRQARRGPARLQGELRQDPRDARLRDRDDRPRRHRRDHRARSTRAASATRSMRRYRNIP